MARSPIVHALHVASMLCAVTSAHAQQAPAARACHGAAATQRGIEIWGGARECGVGELSDSAVWLWNGTSWQRQAGPRIVPREDALLVFSPTDSALLLIGGRRAGTVFEDVFRRDRSGWRAVAASGGPGPIQHGAAAYDPVRKRVVVFGGAVGATFSNRTFEWDGARWHVFAAPGPLPRVGHGMAWSAADGGVLLYGGFREQQFRDLWKWDGARWQQLSSAGPTFTEGHVVAEVCTWSVRVCRMPAPYACGAGSAVYSVRPVLQVRPGEPARRPPTIANAACCSTGAAALTHRAAPVERSTSSTVGAGANPGRSIGVVIDEASAAPAKDSGRDTDVCIACDRLCSRFPLAPALPAEPGTTTRSTGANANLRPPHVQ
jgi:hypothetical protein